MENSKENRVACIKDERIQHSWIFIISGKSKSERWEKIFYQWVQGSIRYLRRLEFEDWRSKIICDKLWVLCLEKDTHLEITKSKSIK